MNSIIDSTRKEINRNALTNSILYGTKALSDITRMNQKPGYIEKPLIKSPAFKAPILTPNTRPFDQARKTMLEESAGARRVAAKTGNPSLNSSIYAQTLKGIDQITSAKSGYLSDIEGKNAQSVADAYNKTVAGNAAANNEATKLQLDMQMKENLLTDQANSSVDASFNTTIGQLGMIGSQKSQSIVDLMYIEKLIGSDTNNSIKTFQPIEASTVDRSGMKKFESPVTASSAVSKEGSVNIIGEESSEIDIGSMIASEIPGNTFGIGGSGSSIVDASVIETVKADEGIMSSTQPLNPVNSNLKSLSAYEKTAAAFKDVSAEDLFNITMELYDEHDSNQRTPENMKTRSAGKSESDHIATLDDNRKRFEESLKALGGDKDRLVKALVLPYTKTPWRFKKLFTTSNNI